MTLTAFIPARGGSKGIPRKNLVPLRGKPLIGYTVEAALSSRFVDEVFLSTDDEEIREYVRSLGVEVEYVRPPELAADETPMMDAVLDCLRYKTEQGVSLPDEFMLLQPTSPLRNAAHIDKAVEQFRNAESRTLLSVHALSEHPFECVKVGASGWAYLDKPDTPSFRRQDYKNDYYYINGAIYLADTLFLQKKKSFFQEGVSELFIMDAEFGIDIDEPLDLKKAQAMMELLGT